MQASGPVKPLCPRCRRAVKDRGVSIQGVLFGPECGSIVYRRQRARESFGESEKEQRVCSVSLKLFFTKKESDDICPGVLCAHCRYNTPPFLKVGLCPLEVEAKQKELDKWK